jgi:hypothetical protein
MSLWDNVLPVVQAINLDGGNFSSMMLNRSVIELLDQAASAGDRAATISCERIQRSVMQGNWPHDPNAFNAIFENYHEGLFYLLAKHRGLQLRHVPEVRGKTPDFSAEAFGENYEVKTLDMTGGKYAYPPIAEAGRASQRSALETRATATKRRSAFRLRQGFGATRKHLRPSADERCEKAGSKDGICVRKWRKRVLTPRHLFLSSLDDPKIRLITLDHVLGPVLPVGRRMTKPVSLSMPDLNGARHECIAEAFDTTYNILLLLYPIRAITGPQIILPQGVKTAAV